LRRSWSSNLQPANFVYDSTLNHHNMVQTTFKSVVWKDIEWLRSKTKLPILLKGILSPEDAKEAVNRGIDGIVVSNHGGRFDEEARYFTFSSFFFFF